MHTKSNTGSVRIQTKLHISVNTVTKSHPGNLLRSSPYQYLIQCWSLSLILARATRTPHSAGPVSAVRAGQPPCEPKPERTARLRAPGPAASASFLRAGRGLSPSPAWAFAHPPRGCGEMPSPNPASFQTRQTKRKRKANLSPPSRTPLESGWWRATRRRLASIAARRTGGDSPRPG